jgi:hypothetical protein
MTNVVEVVEEELCIEDAVVIRLGVCRLRGMRAAERKSKLE